MKYISKYAILDEYNSKEVELYQLKHFVGYVDDNKKCYLKHFLQTRAQDSSLYVENRSAYVVNGRLCVMGKNIDYVDNKINFKESIE